MCRLHHLLPQLLGQRPLRRPAAIVQAHRFIFDSRDDNYSERLNILGQQFGVWRCRTIFNCTNACPREIKVTQAIAEVKQAIATGKV